MSKPMTDVAFDYIKGLNISESDRVSFNSIWDAVKQEFGWNDEFAKSKIGQFYSSLLADFRFFNFGDNTWSLREKQTLAVTHFDMDEINKEMEDSGDSDPEEGNEDIGQEDSEEKSELLDESEDDDNTESSKDF